MAAFTGSALQGSSGGSWWGELFALRATQRLACSSYLAGMLLRSAGVHCHVTFALSVLLFTTASPDSQDRTVSCHQVLEVLSLQLDFCFFLL